MYTEVYDKTKFDWKPADHIVIDDEGHEKIPYGESIYSGRNYDLFAILADVRNGRGFGGVETGGRKIPIDQPRGLPDDVSSFVQDMSDGWGIDGHSHSWFTLKELRDYDWDRVTKNCGILEVKDYEAYVKAGGKGYPEVPYSAGISGNNIKILEAVDYESMKQDKVLKSGIEYYVKIWWEESYRECCSEFLENTIPKLQELADKNGGSQNVRVVFFFDN
jgi:hypothetical protein